MPTEQGGEDPQPRPRKGNRAHKLRRRHKLQDNPMSGGSLRRIYPAVVRQARERSSTTGGEENRERP